MMMIMMMMIREQNDPTESKSIYIGKHCSIVVQIKSNTSTGLDKSNMDRGDLSKIVITRNRSGRIIRCKDDEDTNERGRREESWKRAREDDGRDTSKRSRTEAEAEYRSNRRVFTPPRNAREGEHGSLTVYENENDLPMTSKSLQERVQARLRAIERRHQIEEGNAPPAPEGQNGPGPVNDKSNDVPMAVSDEFPPNESPRGGYQGHWRGGGPGNFDRRSGSGFPRPDYYGNRGGSGYYGRGRGRIAPRWRGQWDDYRGRRPNWHTSRFDDRRRDGPGAGGFDRRRRRFAPSGSADRSPRSSRSRSRSRSRPSKSRSRSYSRSARSSSNSPSPIRPGNRGRVISRARVKTPALAPLTNAKRSDSDENLAELDQFVAQLKAKRQMEQQFQQQQMHYMAQMQENLPPYPGPQRPPDGESSSPTAQQHQYQEETDESTRLDQDDSMNAQDASSPPNDEPPAQPSPEDHPFDANHSGDENYIEHPSPPASPAAAPDEDSSHNDLAAVAAATAE